MTKKEKCKECGFRKRSKKHDEGAHHKKQVPQLKGVRK